MSMSCGHSLVWFRTSACHYIKDVDFDRFSEWLKETRCKKVVHYQTVYAKKYCDVLFNPRKTSILLNLSKAKRRLVMASLSNLSKFLGCYQEWKTTIKQFGLKWEQRNGLETFLSLLNTDINEVKEWLFTTLPILPLKYKTVLVFQTLTGLRPSEASLSLKLLGNLKDHNKLSDYYNPELKLLQHFKYKQFLRKSKNAYISFISDELLENALKVRYTQNYYAIQSYLKKKKIPLRARHLRQLFSTILRNKGVPAEVIDLLQGRIGQSIFMRFYYKPFLQEMKTKTLEAIKPLQEELLSILNS